MNDAGELLRVGEIIDRLDNYKTRGRILAINRDRGLQSVLVRWPGLDDEWCHPGLLMPRAPEASDSGSAS